MQDLPFRQNNIVKFLNIIKTNFDADLALQKKSFKYGFHKQYVSSKIAYSINHYLRMWIINLNLNLI